MTYGLPWQGSKSKIAPWVLDHLPRARTLYEPFCGGCAVTHCAMERGQYDRFVLNDTRPSAAFFKKCAEGGMRGETRWISREDFFKLKGTDMGPAILRSSLTSGRSCSRARPKSRLRVARRARAWRGFESGGLRSSAARSKR